MSIRSSLNLIAGACLLAVAVPIVGFVWHFGGYPLSDDPSEWSAFAQYLGGTAGLVVALVNVGVLVYVALLVHRLESRRGREMVRPAAYLDTGDYENDIFVRVRNFGLGPMVINGLRCFFHDNPATTTPRLEELMPPLGGYSWETFTTEDPPILVPVEGEVYLVRLTGDDDQEGFPEIRETVRRALSQVVVEVDYADIFKEPIGMERLALTVFARHRI